MNARVTLCLPLLPLLLTGSARAESSSILEFDYACVDQRQTAERPPFDPPLIVDPAGNRIIPEGPIFTEPLCPEGTVPLSLVGDPNAEKGNPLITGDSSPMFPDADCDGISWYGSCYYYASASYQRQADGGGMTLTIERPTYVSGGSGHTLAEVAAQGGPGNGNIVEVGWNVSSDQYPDSDPHLFVYHWINGVGTCYDGCSWTQVSKTYFPGMNLSSLIGHKSYSGWVYWNSNWWAWFDNQWLGYFPGTQWEGYRQNGLTQWFGEVASSNGIPPRTQMGNGLFPTNPGAAKMETLCDVNSTDWVCWYRDLQSIHATVPAYYDILHIGFGATRYGGPGM